MYFHEIGFQAGATGKDGIAWIIHAYENHSTFDAHFP
jgi:hypothetical protein